MIFDYFDSLSRVFEVFTSILSFFSSTRSIMESIIRDITSTNIVDVIRPYLGTIRYVAGNTVYITLVRTLQIGMFLVLVRTLYQLVQVILMQFNVQKPMSIIKSLLKI